MGVTQSGFNAVRGAVVAAVAQDDRAGLSDNSERVLQRLGAGVITFDLDREARFNL